jgi:hypothetical protein
MEKVGNVNYRIEINDYVVLKHIDQLLPFNEGANVPITNVKTHVPPVPLVNVPVTNVNTHVPSVPSVNVPLTNVNTHVPYVPSVNVPVTNVDTNIPEVVTPSTTNGTIDAPAQQDTTTETLVTRPRYPSRIRLPPDRLNL